MSAIIKLIDEYDEQIDSLNAESRKVRHLTTILSKEKLSKADVEAAMSLTCYGDLAGCCGPEKECPTQLAVCEALKIDPQELFDLKKVAVDAWLAGELKPEEEN